MSSIWGKNIKISIFGESHGPAIGVTMDGLPAGLRIDMAYIDTELKRRVPGRHLTTPRKENDTVEILSGVFNEYTTGTPLTAIIRNTNTRSSDYKNSAIVPRPSHADYTGYVRYNGFNDPRGGGHFSGRLTAPIVFAGALLRYSLEARGIQISSHIKSIYNVRDKSFNMCGEPETVLSNLRSMDFPVLDHSIQQDMKDIISKSTAELDSVGGVIEGIITNVPAGIGNPIFESIESVLSGIFFSIPGIKGVEFGAGFGITSLKGSDANDSFIVDRSAKDTTNIIKTKTNNSGGISGGISNGMPIVWRVAVKPTPSIAQPQPSFNLSTYEDETLEIRGRHDPCIVVRAIPVLEAASAIAMFDLLK